MSTVIESQRLGRLEIGEDAILQFPEGLIGLSGTRYALVPHDQGGPFSWLVCLDDPDLALPVAEPGAFFADYDVELSDEEAARIGLAEADDPLILVTVRAASKLEDFLANLRAPLVIAGGVGHQVINEAAEAPLRAPLFASAA